MNPTDWRPSASLEAIEARAKLYQQLRSFFQQRNVLEVETPLLSWAASTDVHLASLAVEAETKYLQTSPEFAMKRLLVAGSGAIYQICKCFREGEAGRRHNPEFTMLEWYRPGFDHTQLMREVAELVNELLGERPVGYLSYRRAFQTYLGVDPFQVSLAELAELTLKHCHYQSAGDDRDTLLDLLMSQVVEPNLGRDELTFIYDYPASQCALAKVATDEQGESVAQRFELYIEGIELANGYHELTDADEQQRRFDVDLAKREAQGLPKLPEEQRLVAALRQGMPECAGVAMGLDRLLMLMLECGSIRDVVAFPVDRA